MKKFITASVLSLILTNILAAQGQEIPKKALCAVCVLRGETEKENVKAHAKFDGETYYFCSKGCEKEFLADPKAYTKPVFPRPAPNMAVTTLDGKDATLKDFLGKVVLLDFWATWCKPCLKIMPELQALHAANADNGFTVVGVSIDEGKNSLKKIRKFLGKLNISYPIFWDSKATPAWHTFKVKAIPATFLIDRDGQIVGQWAGVIDHKEIESATAKILSPVDAPNENE